MKKLTMVSIVMRHLSGIQKGIQSGHADKRYIRENWTDEDLQQWIQTNETVWVLQVNTTDDLMQAYNELLEYGVKVALFNEPDLSSVPSICFLVDEVAIDKDFAPDAPFQLNDKSLQGKQLYEARKIAQNLANKVMYGERTAFLREISYRYPFATN